MPDASLELLIKTVADLQAAKALRDELQSSITRSKLLGKSFSEQQEQLDRLNSEITKYTDKTGDAGEQTKPFAEHMGEVKKSVRELSHEFPLAGLALRAFINPMGAAIGIGIGLFATFKEKLTEWNKTMDETAALAAKSAGNMASAMEDARREIAADANQISLALKKISEAYADETQKADLATEAIRRHEQAQIAVVDAKEAVDLARLETQRKLHQADPHLGLDDVSAAIQEERIKQQSAHRRIEIQNDAEQKEAAQRQAKLDAAFAQQHQLQKVYDPLNADRVHREAKLKDIPDNIKHYEELKAANEKEIETAKKAVDDRESYLNRSKTLDRFGLAPTGAVASNSEQLAQAEKHLEEVMKLGATYDRTIKAAKDEQTRFQTDKKNYEDAKAALEELSKSLPGLTKEVTAFYTTIKENAADRENLFNINQRAAAEHVQQAEIKDAPTMAQGSFRLPASDEISKSMDISRRAATGEKVSPGEEQYVQTIGTMVAGQNVTIKQAETMFNTASKNQALIDGFMGRLMKALEKIPDFTKYNDRLDKLEQKVEGYRRTAANQ